MRRLVAPLIVVAVLALLWCGGWYWAAAWAESQVPGVLARIEERGIDVECTDRRLVGFPFSLKAACSATSVGEPRSGTQARLAGLTGGISVFAPRTAKVSLHSPVHVESPLIPGPAELSWSDADIDIGLGMNGPRAVSFDTADLAASIPGASVAAGRAAGTLAPTEDGGTEAELSFAGLALSAAGITFPPFDGSASARLSVPPRALLAGRAGLQAPLSARAVKVSLAAGVARIEAEGDLTVDAEGVLDGTIVLRIAGAEALPAFIAALPPEQQKFGNMAIGGIIAFGEPGKLDGEPATELLIEIKQGEAKIGPREVRLPRLPL